MSDLLSASLYGRLDRVQHLIGVGADVDVKNEDGYTPLLLSAQIGCVDIVKALIAAGADVDVKDKYGDTPLLLSAERGCVDIVKALIAAGADVDMKDSGGYTALLLSAGTGFVDIVKALIAAGADVDVKNEDGVTPLERANSKNNEKMCLILIKYKILNTATTIKPKFVNDNWSLNDMWNICEEQVKKLKETFLGHSGISFFKFLTESDKNKLAIYLSEKNFGINNAERRTSYIEEFFMYSEDIEAQFIKGTERACFLHKSQELMKNYLFKSLPLDIIRKISEYMENDDLENFFVF